MKYPYYRLNVCSPNMNVETLKPNVMVFEDGDFGGVIMVD